LMCLAAGFGSSRLIRVKKGEIRESIDMDASNLYTWDNERAVIASDSVFGGGKTTGTGIDSSVHCLMSFVQMKSMERRARLVRDCSQVSPLIPILVCGDHLMVTEAGNNRKILSLRGTNVVRLECENE
jgi:hypothetical protein